MSTMCSTNPLLSRKKRDVTKRIHRSIFPYTDHGYTWIETCWYEHEEGKRCSPQFPVAGCCARLMHLPGGPIPLADFEWEERDFNVVRTVKTEQEHPEFHYVGTVSITQTR